MIGLRGFGAVDVGPLAQAQFSGHLHPDFLQTQYFQPSYMPVGQMSPIGYAYPTDAFAQAIASLLGGSVVQAPPPGNLNGTGIPPSNWVRASDGTMIAPGNLFQPGTVLSFQDECGAEQYLAASIPGGQMSATCASGGTGLTPTQMAVDNGATIPQLPAGQSTVVGYASNPNIRVAPPSIPTPVLPTSPVSLAPSVPAGSGPANPPAPAPPQSNGSQAIAANPPILPGGTPPVNPPAAGASNGVVVTCDWKSVFGGTNACPAGVQIDWITLLTDTDLGPIPNWVWMAGAVLGAIFLNQKGGR